MTLVVEDGTALSNANTYVSAADFITYAAARGITIVPGEAEGWLILAMDYLETLPYIGVKWSRLQPLQWPRYGVIIDSWYRNVSEIPPELIKAQNECAMQISLGNDPLQNRDPATKSEQVGSIKVEYASGASTITLPVKVFALLSKLTSGCGFKVGRA